MQKSAFRITAGYWSASSDLRESFSLRCQSLTAENPVTIIV